MPKAPSTPKFARVRLALALGALVWFGAAPVHALDPLGWIPSDTRVVFEIDPVGAERGPKARQAVGLDELWLKLVTAKIPSERLQQRVVAYIQEGTAASPLTFTFGKASLAETFDRLKGSKLESAGGKSMYAASTKDWGLTLLEPGCILEGPRQTLRAVLQNAAAHGRMLADLPEGQASRRLLAAPAGPASAVSLVYLAPSGGSDIFAILQDLDRILGAEMSSVLASYQSPLKMLGTTNGLRLDLEQQRQELETTLRLAMPNAMAAQIASVSLQAGKDMAKAASEAAVKAGSMTEQDALVLGAALSTLTTQADGDLVRVHLRVNDAVSPRGER